MKQTTQTTSDVRLGHTIRFRKPSNASPMTRFARISENITHIRAKLIRGLSAYKRTKLEGELAKLTAAAMRLSSELQGAGTVHPEPPFAA